MPFLPCTHEATDAAIPLQSLTGQLHMHAHMHFFLSVLTVSGHICNGVQQIPSSDPPSACIEGPTSSCASHTHTHIHTYIQRWGRTCDESMIGTQRHDMS